MPILRRALPPASRWGAAAPEGVKWLDPAEREWAARETDRQVRGGTFAAPILYPVFTVLFLLGGSYPGRYPLWSAVFMVSVLGASALRAIFLARWHPLTDRDAAAKRRRHGVHVLAGSAAWSAFVCFALMADGVMWLTLMLFIVGAGSASAISANLAPHLRVAQLHHLIIHVPTAVAAISLGGAPGVTLGAVMLAALGYQLWEARVRCEAHWQSIVNLALLKQRQRANKLLTSALDHAAEGIAVIDLDGRARYVNRAFRAILGPTDTGTATVTGIGSLLPAPARDAIGRGEPWTGDIPFHDDEGRVRHHAATLSPVRNGEGEVTHHTCVWRDETERRAMQSRLVLTDRLAAVGTMAAGIAHEINNPLASLMLDLEELEREASPTAEAEHVRREPAIDLITDGLEAARRVRDIVRQLELFARQDEEAGRSARLGKVLDAAADMASNEVRHRAELRREYDPNLPAVVGDEGRLVQVFVNLLVNAAQALDHVPNRAHRVTLTAEVEDGVATVRVTDTGPGFPEQALGSAFDPFFTTKAIGEGTGLGLSVCHGIVQAAGGRIRLRNLPDGGAAAEVELPLAEPVPATEDPDRPSHRAPVRSRSLRILVVDDDPHVGRAVGRVLRNHQVTVVGDGEMAVERWMSEPFDVMLCDLMMPGFTGMDVYHALADTAPGDEKRIVFMTGGAFTPPMRDFLASVDNEVVEKPFEGPRIRQVLQAKAELRAARTG